ncbi:MULTISPECIES: hypothetical protein [Cupriavidus]
MSIPALPDADVLRERVRLRLVCSEAEALAPGPIRRAIEAAAHARRSSRAPAGQPARADLKKLAAGDNE